ncbi:MAG: GntR family transcriptional regulator [Limnochordia bacterium]|jgi:GntR family transcriptional regulator|nr:GntR family transcriptional regulator [Limnochordia bacterium]
MQSELKIKVEKRPLYLRVAQLLTEEITEGVFAQEDKLPSEEKLGKMLGVSRATIREALSALEKQGMLRRVQGLGTILTHEQKIPIGHGMERLLSYTEYISRYGLTPGTSSVQFHWEQMRPSHKKIFGQDIPMIGVLERTRTADEKPLMVSVDFIPMNILGPEFQLEYVKQSLFTYLQKRGAILAYSEMRIAAAIAKEDMAEKLDIIEGAPLLVIDETYYDNHNQAVLVSSNAYRVDRWEFKIYRTRTEEG